MPINYFNIENGITGFSQKDYQTEPHSHFVIEVVFALSGSINIGTLNDIYSNIRAAIISSNMLHTFSCLDGKCQIYFVDPTANIGEYLLKHYNIDSNDLVVFDKAFKAEKFKEEFDFSTVDIEHNRFISFSKKRDDRVQRCLDLINEHQTEESMHISMLADKVFLSESRLAHLFKEQIGISIHQYILWKKMERAAKKSQEGASLTECAYFAGFSDSSHLNKVFNKMFGVNPFFALKK